MTPIRHAPERSIRAVSLASCLTLAWLFGPAPARGHGWHNAALATSSLEEWLSDVQRAIPDILKRANETELRAGRGLEDLRKSRPNQGKDRPNAAADRRGRQILSTLTPQQQELLGRKADDALEALAFMEPNNIVPEEFPRFDLSKIPQYRETAVKLLKLMGPVGTRAVVSELRAELMGMGRSANARDYRVNPAYYDSLLALLHEGVATGQADAEDLKDLRVAAKGFKPAPFDALARSVEETLLAAEASRETLPKLADRLIAPRDARIKELLTGVLAKRLAEASGDELAKLMQHEAADVRQKAVAELSRRSDELSIAQLIEAWTMLPDRDLQTRRVLYEIFSRRASQAENEELLAMLQSKDAALRKLAQGYLAKGIRSQQIADLLEMQQAFSGEPFARSVAAELSQRNPKYSEVKDQLEKIVAYLGSADADTAQAAERQSANAFQRAPIRDCLRWLAVDDDRLRTLIWKQIDGRIARADAERKSGYRQVAFEELADKENELDCRLASLELLDRLQDRQAVEPLIELLPQLPHELWPKSGETLRHLTGQSFGPRPGGGAAELNADLAKWRDWLKKNNKM